MPVDQEFTAGQQIQRPRNSAGEGETMAASTHPPFDPELSAVLAALPAELQEPMTIEDIPARREQLTQLLPADDDALRREGAVELEERQIPGPDGAPDLSVLILRPAGGPGGRERGRALPGVYH